jgi:hypothetical protein
VEDKILQYAAYLALPVVFGIACTLGAVIPASWAYTFGAGLLIGALITVNSWTKSRIPIVLCLSIGSITGPTIAKYPVTEILGLYLAVAMLVAASAWWWNSPSYSSSGGRHS